MKSCFVLFVSASLLISCNDDKGVNNSTPEVSNDTTANTEKTPVVTKTKKSGKISTNTSAEDTKLKMEKDKMG